MLNYLERNSWIVIAFAILFIMAVAAWPKFAKADDYNVTVGTAGYSVAGPNGAIIVAPLGSANPRVIHVPPSLTDRGRIHDLRWRLRCHPKLRMDNLGVSHFIYAKAGCEFGADRDANFETDEDDK